MTTKPFTGPPPIYVFVTIEPTKRNGVRERWTSRAGTCHDEAGIAKIIADDKKAMRETYGGLIDAPGTSGRTYRAFRATWQELKITQ